MPSLSMSRSQREAFLAGTHVAILSVADGARGPLTLPVWYRYEPDAAVRFVTGAASRKLGTIKKAGRVTLCVQTETAPYEYVTVEGTRRFALNVLGARGKHLEDYFYSPASRRPDNLDAVAW